MEYNDVTVRLFTAIRETVRAEGQRFHSYSLGEEDGEDDELVEKISPPIPARKNDTKLPKRPAELKAAMEKAGGAPVADDLVRLAWEYRTVFGQVQPGSVVGHSHTIDLNTTKDVRAKPYPLRGEAQIEAARTQIKALVDAGMERPVTYSNFAAPVVVVN